DHVFLAHQLGEPLGTPLAGEDEVRHAPIVPRPGKICLPGHGTRGRAREAPLRAARRTRHGGIPGCGLWPYPGYARNIAVARVSAAHPGRPGASQPFSRETRQASMRSPTPGFPIDPGAEPCGPGKATCD